MLDNNGGNFLVLYNTTDGLMLSPSTTFISCGQIELGTLLA